MSRWDTWEYDELVDVLSDYHKDVFGFRLRMNGEPREAVIAELVYLDNYMEIAKSTALGRAHLRSNGWDVPEPNC